MKYIPYVMIDALPKVVMLPIGPLERKRLCITREEETRVYRKEIPLWPVMAQRERFRRELFGPHADPTVRFWQVEDELLTRVEHSLLDQKDVSSELLEWYGFRWDEDQHRYFHGPSGLAYIPGVPLRKQNIPGLWDVEAFGIHYVMSVAIRDRVWRENRRKLKPKFQCVGVYDGRVVLCNARFHMHGRVVGGEFRAAFHYPCVPSEHVPGASMARPPHRSMDAKTTALAARLPGKLACEHPGPRSNMGHYFAPEYFGFYGAKAFTRERMILAARIIALRGTTLR